MSTIHQYFDIIFHERYKEEVVTRCLTYFVQTNEVLERDVTKQVSHISSHLTWDGELTRGRIHKYGVNLRFRRVDVEKP